MKNPLSHIGDLLLWLSAADPEIIALCDRVDATNTVPPSAAKTPATTGVPPAAAGAVSLRPLRVGSSERTKHLALGGTVLTTGGLAFAASAYTASAIFHAGAFAALSIGLIWALIIVNLDRYLLGSLRRQRTVGLTIALAVPRVLIALVVGLLIAEPLVLRAFEKEVGVQALETREARYQDGIAALDSPRTELNRLRARHRTLLATVTAVQGGGTIVNDPEYRQIAKEVARLQTLVNRANQLAECEVTKGCTYNGRPGDGPQAAQRRRIADRYQSQLDAKQRELTAVTRRLRAQSATADAREKADAQKELAAIAPRIKRLEADEAATKDSLEAAYKRPPGLADRMDALDEVSGASFSVGSTRHLLEALILAIDVAPALFKLLLLLGTPTLYERMERMREREIVKNRRRLSTSEGKAVSIMASLPLTEARLRQRFLKDAIEDLTRQAVEVQKHVAERALEDWKAEVLAEMAQRRSAAPIPPAIRSAAAASPGGASVSGDAASTAPALPRTSTGRFDLDDDPAYPPIPSGPARVANPISTADLIADTDAMTSSIGRTRPRRWDATPRTQRATGDRRGDAQDDVDDVTWSLDPEPDATVNGGGHG
jgi:hypothetical protein